MLSDWRWLARREEIMALASYACDECGLAFDPNGDLSGLNVHHRYYRAGAAPWEYEDDELRCLCRSCHELITDELERVHRAIGRLPLRAITRVIRFVESITKSPVPMSRPMLDPEETATR
jgi:5-methylcytosine-specific restriction endonuclease McrA